MPGVVEPPPPIFLDVHGNPLGMDAPVIGAPEGEVVQGEAMDLGEEKESRSKKGDPEEEPEVEGAIAKQWANPRARDVVQYFQYRPQFDNRTLNAS